MKRLVTVIGAMVGGNPEGRRNGGSKTAVLDNVGGCMPRSPAS
jgi:hypothetical protein